MRRVLWFCILIGLMSGGWAQIEDDQRPVVPVVPRGEVRVVYEVSSADIVDNGISKGLSYLERLLNFYQSVEVPRERLHLHGVFHGEAAAFLLNNAAWKGRGFGVADNPNSGLVGSLIEQGVRIELCDVRRQREGWTKSEILSGVVLTQAAYPRLIELQQQGYAHLKF